MAIFKLRSKIIFVMLIVAIVPLNVFALSGTDSNETSRSEASDKTQTRTLAAPATDEKRAEQKQLLKCQAVDGMAIKIKEQLSQKKAEIESKRSKVQKNTVDRQDNREKTLLEKRAEWDVHREENFTKLRAKATTNAQKEAVEVYIKTIMTAIAKHRASNDAAFAEFRTAVTALKSSVSQSVRINVTNTSAQVDAVIAGAKTACANGQSVDSVRQNLRTQLQMTRTESKQDRQSINISQGMKEIVQKRKDAVKASAVIFEAAVHQARETLLVAFKDDTKTVE